MIDVGFAFIKRAIRWRWSYLFAPNVNSSGAGIGFASESRRFCVVVMSTDLSINSMTLTSQRSVTCPQKLISIRPKTYNEHLSVVANFHVYLLDPGDVVVVAQHHL